MNLRPEFRSNLRSINLLGCANSKLIKKYGVDKFLRPFIDDMRKFPDEINMTIRGKEKMYRGVIGNVVGDMLASNNLGGFKETASALSPCRICHISKAEQDVVHRESLCTLRDKESYERQLDEIFDPDITQKFRKQLQSKYGINRRCCFSVLKYFDPTMIFSHDVMHVCDKGILNLETRLFLEILVFDKEIVSIDQINYFIVNLIPTRQFTRPPPIRAEEVKNNKKLSYSSSEMSCLAEILPLFIGNYCSVNDDPYYANFILLLEICASLKCYSFTERNLIELENDIERHNVGFSVLYRKSTAGEAGQTITPKLHSLLHMVRQIRLFGAPRYAWCYRYESKNAPFKKVMRRNCNYTNIPFTMSNHHQKLAGLDLRSNGDSDYFDTAVVDLNVYASLGDNSKKKVS